MRPYTELKVWKLAHETVLEVYQRTATFPKEERFGLIAQLRRSAAAVPANLAEGARARHVADFARIVNIAEKECSEAGYHLMLARDLGYLDPDDCGRLLERFDVVARMLNRLYTAVRRQKSSGSPGTGDEPPTTR